jgi:putative ABC transport system permease protein
MAEHATGIGSAVQSELAALNRSIPIGEVQTMTTRLAQDLAYPRFRARVFGGFAVAALILAAVGVYGVLAQFVAQRRREFAVRMAIGATKRDIVLLVAWHGGLPVAVGVLAGLVCASAGTRVLSGLVYGVKAADPLLLGAMSLTLLAVAAAAMALPARRAATVDPMVALRDE